MFRRPTRRRNRNGLWPMIARVFYIDPKKQYLLIMLSAIAMAGLIFSGILLFRQSDHGDLLGRGRWYMRQGKAAIAAKEFEQLVSKYGGSYDGHLELGKAYMSIDEPEKAAKEFRIASRLKAGNLKESGAHVALSRMMISEGKYEDAEKQLFQAYNARPQNKKDPELLMAFADLYDEWGDSYLSTESSDYEKAFMKYSMALRYSRSVDQQKPIQEKLLRAANHLANVYDNQKEYDKAISVMKYTLHYAKTTDNLVAIGALYEEKEDLDNAITWYKEAYALDPKVISLRLSMLLTRRGNEMNEAHRVKEAEAFFAEAQKINSAVKLPTETLYPVEATDLKVTYTLNPGTLEMIPVAKFNIANDGGYPVKYMSVRVYFMSGEQKLADAQQVIATVNDPLAPHGNSQGVRALEMKPVATIPLEDLDKGKLKVKIMVSYTEAADSKWVDVKTAEIKVKETERLESPKPRRTT